MPTAALVAKVKTAISATGSRAAYAGESRGAGLHGFSLVELLVVLTILGFILAATAPASGRFYDNMRQRAAVREAVGILTSARERALLSGQHQDVFVRPAARRLWSERQEQVLPDGLTLTVHGSAELNLDDTGVIRFYPDGSASGGGVDIQRRGGPATRIAVDWLLGRVTHEPLQTP